MRRYYKNYPNLNEHKRSWLADWLTRKLVKKGLKFKIIKSVDFDDLEKMPEYNAFMLDRDRSKIYCEGWFSDMRIWWAESTGKSISIYLIRS